MNRSPKYFYSEVSHTSMAEQIKRCHRLFWGDERAFMELRQSKLDIQIAWTCKVSDHCLYTQTEEFRSLFEFVVFIADFSLHLISSDAVNQLSIKQKLLLKY